MATGRSAATRRPAREEQCALIQSVTAEDRPNVGLTVMVLKTADQKSRILRVLAPLGVLLPSGLGLKIDDTDVGRAGFVRCLPNGCVAEVVMDDTLVEQAAHRQDRDLHHLPDARRGHRHPDEPEGLRRGLRQAAFRPDRGRGRSLGQGRWPGCQPRIDLKARRAPAR